MLTAVPGYIRKLLSYCRLAIVLAYSKPTILKYGDFSLLSQSGLQQGIGLALFFCLHIQLLLSSIHSPLCKGFLDDLVLGGTVTTVASDVQTTIREAGHMDITPIASLSVESYPWTSLLSHLCLLGAPLSLRVELLG